MPIPYDAVMMRRRFVGFTVAWVLCAGIALVSGLRVAADSLPSQLSDQEFWKLSSDFSETDGFFRSDNLLSNEIWMQHVIPDLLANIKTRSEEHTSELQSRRDLVCRLLLEKK